MQLELLNEQGQAASTIDAPETVFGRAYNEDLIHQLVTAYRANGRQGTRAQKDREQVRHTTAKPFKQRVLAVHVPVCLPRLCGVGAVASS